MVLLFGYGPDAPPRKLLRKRTKIDSSSSIDNSFVEKDMNNRLREPNFSWKPVLHFLFWILLWSSYVLVLCGIYARQHGGLKELFRRFC